MTMSVLSEKKILTLMVIFFFSVFLGTKTHLHHLEPALPLPYILAAINFDDEEIHQHTSGDIA